MILSTMSDGKFGKLLLQDAIFIYRYRDIEYWALLANLAGDKLIVFLFFPVMFSSCKLSCIENPKPMFWEKNKNISECRLLKCLPCKLSGNFLDLSNIVFFWFFIYTSLSKQTTKNDTRVNGSSNKNLKKIEQLHSNSALMSSLYQIFSAREWPFDF